MRYPRKWQLALVCLLALALVPFAPAPRGTAQAPGYTLTDLGTLGAGAESRAYGLDECGQVVGESQAVAGAAAPFRPFQWNNGVMTDLGTLGGSSGTAVALNQSGTSVGSSPGPTQLNPFVRPAGGPMQNLGTLPGGNTAEAHDINASGKVVGVSEEGGLQDRAFIWQSGTGMQGMTAPWGKPIRAFGINDAGQVAGSANVNSGPDIAHAFVTIGGTPVDLLTLGGPVSVATEVNDAGEVSGYSYIFSATITQSFHAFFWKDANNNGQSDSGEMHDLGVLGGDRNSFGYDLNNAGQIVGLSETGTNSNNVTRAFLWTSADGMRDLNVVVPGTGWTFQEAHAINNRGQIVGTGLNPDGKVHAFLLTPTNVGPSPCDPTPTPTPTPVPGTLQFSAATYTVGESAGSAVISVSRTGGSDGAVSINYATSTGGTATAGSDYTAIASGTLNFAAGETTKTFGVTINEDTLDEADETVNLTLSTPGGGATLGAQSTAVLTITDNDTATLSISDATVDEGDAGMTNATFTVTLSTASVQTVTVNYATADVTATQPADYTTTSGTLTFTPGQTTKTFNVPVVGDTIDEPDEGFGVGLSAETNATITGLEDRLGVGTIRDDDGTPSLTISSAVAVTEGNSGTTAATFTVSLSGTSSQTVTVNYSTADESATAPSDYTAVTNIPLTFTPGQTSKTITVNVKGDTTPESHETFIVFLSGATNAMVGAGGQGRVTINNDDTTLTIFDLDAAEGNSGFTAFNFAVTLSHPTVNAVSVNYATSNGTATPGSDYTAITTPATLNISAGSTTGTISVQVVGDTTFEEGETFFLNLSGASAGVTLAKAQIKGTILNDEAASFIQFGSANYSIGEAGPSATINVTRVGSTAGGVTVNYATSNGTATAVSDYTATSGTVTFAAGADTTSFNVPITQDTLFEGDETVILTLSSPFGGTVSPGPPSTLNINDDDTAPSLQFGSTAYNILEGRDLPGGGPVTVTITVKRTGGSNAVTVNYATSGDTAIAGSDYTAATSGTLTFAEGDNEETFTVTTVDDALDEAVETVNLTLSSPGGGATLGSPSAVVFSIFDNDPQPTISVADAPTVTEGNAGAVNATFNVNLSAASGQTVTVDYLAINDTAVQPTDFAATDGKLTFAPGETSKSVTVAVNGDTLDEPDETFALFIFNPTNVGVSDSTGVCAIKDDDGSPSLSINDINIPELGGIATFTVTLSAASGQTVTVDYTTANGTATAGPDYGSKSGTLTFAPGETSQQVLILTASDNIDEADETFFVNLSGATNATIADAQGVGTLLDNDATPALFVNDVTVTEGDAGTTNATFTVTLGTPGSGRTVTVDYATSNGTAAAPGDYAATSGSLTFAPGEITKTVTVQVMGDTVNEPNETFSIVLSNPSHAFLLDALGDCTIQNDDAPALRFSQATYPAGESAHFVTVTVTRAGDPAPTVGVSFATSDGGATERRDYTAVSGRLQFAAGETSKTFDVLLTEDAYTEQEETINLTLSNPTGGASLGSQATATVNIAADDDPPPSSNPIDVSSDFVRQHYHDFLNREPDASGLAFWTQEIEQCGANAACREGKRINVSAAFFLSIEFQQTGYLVYRTYKAAYGDASSPNVEGTVPVVRLQEFLPDTRVIGEGVVVGQPNWEQKLEANKNAYMAEFVQRQRFLTAFPTTLTAAQFVDKLNQNAGGVLTQGERDNLIAALSSDPGGAAARASALRSVAENAALQQNEFRRAFVLMQFFGYLRRNPDDPQDVDFRGWKFWLDKLNQFNGNYVQAEMVKAFLDSIEYRTRFAP